MSDSGYRRLVNDLVSSGFDARRPKHDICEEIVARVLDADADNEPWAGETTARWYREGAAKDYTDAHKALNSVTYIRRDGRKLRKTTSYSRPRRSADSGEILGQQMQIWWGMSRAELYDLRADVATQNERLADVVTVIDLLIAAMDRHPECETARDAWEVEGRSVDEIDLGEVAG